MSTPGEPSSSSTNPDLESFREQWRAEVRARVPGGRPSSSSSSTQQPPRYRHRAVSSATAAAGHPITQPPPPTHKPPVLRDYEDDYVQPRSFGEQTGATTGKDRDGDGEVRDKGVAVKEPVSALEHYEKAVERESAGSLGDSLRLYRKAFRMDDLVDQQYKNKHFPKAAVKAPDAPAALEGAGVPDAAAKPLTIKELIASFAGLAIEPAQPEVEGTPELPCPIASLPDEILVHILRDVAVQDVGDYLRLARVCKRLAYLIATEDRIWRRICLGPEWGFGGMHYHWQMGISWEPFNMEDLLREAEAEIKAREQAQIDAGTSDDEDVDKPPMILTVAERSEKHARESTATTLALFRSPVYNSSWQRMFRLRPRIRFGGCYISTANYIRPGQAATAQYTWASPVHIVTYFRYLRFFRDGSVLSLLTTTEPGDVVHHLTKEKAALHAKGANPHLPSHVLQAALRGRWRLVGVDEKDPPKSTGPAKPSPTDIEGDVVVETEGVMSKYIYRMDLSLRSSGGGKGAGRMPRNNKLVWRGFYSYDRLTDDWAEFGLRNDKPFFFSRVGSYGIGGE